MASFFQATIYGANTNDYKRGQAMGFNAATVNLRAFSPAVVYGNVNCNTIIAQLPVGPSTAAPIYFTDLTIAAIQALATTA